MKKYYSLYYSLIGLISLAAVIQTVFVGSLHVQHGRQFKNLSIEKNNLEAKKSELQLALAKEQNLDSLQAFVISEGFESISQVAYLSKSSALASR